MATITLKPGDVLTVKLADTDGEFEIVYGFNHVTVTTDIPDVSGRVGEIYSDPLVSPTMERIKKPEA